MMGLYGLGITCRDRILYISSGLWSSFDPSNSETPRELSRGPIAAGKRRGARVAGLLIEIDRRPGWTMGSVGECRCTPSSGLSNCLVEAT